VSVPEKLLPLLARKLTRERYSQTGAFLAMLFDPRLSRRKVYEFYPHNFLIHRSLYLSTTRTRQESFIKKTLAIFLLSALFSWKGKQQLFVEQGLSRGHSLVQERPNHIPRLAIDLSC
jgi:hypothetical protein